MPAITLYQHAGDLGVESGSPFCVKIHRLLGLKGLRYRPQEVGGPSELARLNPQARKVPVLEYDGERVTDSSRIFAFIDQRHPDPPLWPADPLARARALLLEDWADESLYWFAVYQRWAIDSNFTPFARRAFGAMPPPLRWFVPAMVRKQVRRQLHGQGIGRLRLEQVLAMLEAHLGMLGTLLAGGGFLAGERPSGADLAVFAPLEAMSVTATMPEAAAVVRRHGDVLAWLQRVDEATASEHTVPLGD